MKRMSVWLGCRASIWSHRGYEVRGETVYTSSRKDARRIVRESLGDDVIRVQVDDGEYYYREAETADRDDTGVLADAIVSVEEVEGCSHEESVIPANGHGSYCARCGETLG